MSLVMSQTNAAAETKVSAAELFQERFAFIVVSRRRPAFVTKVDSLKVMADDQEVRPEMAKTQVTLLPANWEKRLNSAFGAVVRVAEKHTLPFELGTVNVRVLARSAQTQFWLDVAAARKSLAAELNEFLTAYETDVVAWNREQWKTYFSNEQYEATIGSRLPTVAELADPKKRRLGVFVFTIGISEDYLFTESSEAVEAEAARACANGRKELRASIEGCVGALRGRIYQAVEKLAEQLNTGTRLSVNSLTETHDAIVLARSFADMTEPSLLAELGRMEKQLQAARSAAEGATGLKGDTQTAALMAHKNGLLSAIEQLEAVCTDPNGVKQVMVNRFGAAPRLIVPRSQTAKAD